ncbi:PIN domain-containing protein [Sorangium sp. So ce1000]|uniref:PIN domain-containing protein n=1 Tax=Sorangium sp. So ce1000 TaxID=3133325 RepID=UPI003F60D344
MNVASELRKAGAAHPRFIDLVDARESGRHVSLRARGGGDPPRNREPASQGFGTSRDFGYVVRPHPRIVSFGGRILPVTQEIAETWGRLSVPDRLPTADGLLAATALVHNLILVTRNTRDVARIGVKLLNPFDEATSEP